MLGATFKAHLRAGRLSRVPSRPRFVPSTCLTAVSAGGTGPSDAQGHTGALTHLRQTLAVRWPRLLLLPLPL